MENKVAKIKLGRFNITLYTDCNHISENELFCIFNIMDVDCKIIFANSLTVVLDDNNELSFIPFEHEHMPD